MASRIKEVSEHIYDSFRGKYLNETFKLKNRIISGDCGTIVGKSYSISLYDGLRLSPLIIVEEKDDDILVRNVLYSNLTLKTCGEDLTQGIWLSFNQETKT